MSSEGVGHELLAQGYCDLGGGAKVHAAPGSGVDDLGSEVIRKYIVPGGAGHTALQVDLDLGGAQELGVELGLRRDKRAMPRHILGKVGRHHHGQPIVDRDVRIGTIGVGVLDGGYRTPEAVEVFDVKGRDQAVGGDHVAHRHQPGGIEQVEAAALREITVGGVGLDDHVGGPEPGNFCLLGGSQGAYGATIVPDFGKVGHVSGVEEAGWSGNGGGVLIRRGPQERL